MGLNLDKTFLLIIYLCHKHLNCPISGTTEINECTYSHRFGDCFGDDISSTTVGLINLYNYLKNKILSNISVVP